MKPALAFLLLALPVALCAQVVSMTRAQAVNALDDPSPTMRVRGVQWLAKNGTAADDKLLLPHLSDDNHVVREVSQQAMWVLWSRSGDDEVDALLAKGVAQMNARDFTASIVTFSEVIKRKPQFAEGWNKRATALFLAGDLDKSLADCDEVLKRNPYHFGALSGYGQIYFAKKSYDKAIEYWTRAMKVNPNLGLQQNIDIARQLRDQTQKRSA